MKFFDDWFESVDPPPGHSAWRGGILTCILILVTSFAASTIVMTVIGWLSP